MDAGSFYCHFYCTVYSVSDIYPDKYGNSAVKIWDINILVTYYISEYFEVQSLNCNFFFYFIYFYASSLPFEISWTLSAASSEKAASSEFHFILKNLYYKKTYNINYWIIQCCNQIGVTKLQIVTFRCGIDIARIGWFECFRSR